MLPTPENPDVLLPWGPKVANHHNVRALCDIMGLSYKDKLELAACVMQESQFDINAIHPNYVFENGQRVLASTDYGLCQWNDKYHGKEITPDQSLHNPEMAVRLMCKYWLADEKSQWCSFSSGAYLKYYGKI